MKKPTPFEELSFGTCPFSDTPLLTAEVLLTDTDGGYCTVHLDAYGEVCFETHEGWSIVPIPMETLRPLMVLADRLIKANDYLIYRAARDPVLA
jgi:hypothetical protein